MAKLKSEQKREDILKAAIEAIAELGLVASTAEIAKRAKISSGSLFTYFNTKNDLLNTLYVEIKKEVLFLIVSKINTQKILEEQFKQLWLSWIEWGVENPSKRQALEYLSVSDVITEETKKEVLVLQKEALNLIHLISQNNVPSSVPFEYICNIIESLASTTIKFIDKNDDKYEDVSSFSVQIIRRIFN